MYERSYGYLYNQLGEYPTAAQIAKAVRTDIKQAVTEGLLPSRWSYSVASDTFSGGRSVDVVVRDCPDAWAHDPDTCLATRREHGEGELTGCLLCADRKRMLSGEAEAADMTLKRIHDAYNHDGSDITTDYFDVRYYGQVRFETVHEQARRGKEKARKAARTVTPRPNRAALAAHLEQHHRLNTRRMNFDTLTFWHRMAHQGDKPALQAERHTDHDVTDLGGAS